MKIQVLHPEPDRSGFTGKVGAAGASVAGAAPGRALPPATAQQRGPESTVDEDGELLPLAAVPAVAKARHTPLATVGEALAAAKFDVL